MIQKVVYLVGLAVILWICSFHERLLEKVFGMSNLDNMYSFNVVIEDNGVFLIGNSQEFWGYSEITTVEPAETQRYPERIHVPHDCLILWYKICCIQFLDCSDF